MGDLNTALWASPASLKDDELCRAVTRMQRSAAEYLTPGGHNDDKVWHDLLVTQYGLTDKVAAAVLSNVGAQWQFDARRQGQFEAVGKALVATGTLKHEPDYEALYARKYWAF